MGKYVLGNCKDQALTHVKKQNPMHGSACNPSTVELGVGWISRNQSSHSQVGELQVQWKTVPKSNTEQLRRTLICGLYRLAHLGNTLYTDTSYSEFVYRHTLAFPTKSKGVKSNAVFTYYLGLVLSAYPLVSCYILPHLFEIWVGFLVLVCFKF